MKKMRVVYLSIPKKIILLMRKMAKNLMFNKKVINLGNFKKQLNKIINMKKLFLLIATISISFGAMSQKGKVTSALSLIEQGSLDKAKEALDQAFPVSYTHLRAH